MFRQGLTLKTFWPWPFIKTWFKVTTATYLNTGSCLVKSEQLIIFGKRERNYGRKTLVLKISVMTFTIDIDTMYLV